MFSLHRIKAGHRLPIQTFADPLDAACAAVAFVAHRMREAYVESVQGGRTWTATKDSDLSDLPPSWTDDRVAKQDRHFSACWG